jgi:hypothetical protein
MFAALKALGANIQYTELPGVDHNAWDPAYGRADLIAVDADAETTIGSREVSSGMQLP